MEKQSKRINKSEIRVRLGGMDSVYKNKSIEEIPNEVKLAYVKMLFIQFIDKVCKESIIEKYYTDDIKLLVVDYLDGSSLLWYDSEYGDRIDDELDDELDDGLGGEGGNDLFNEYGIDLMGGY